MVNHMIAGYLSSDSSQDLELQGYAIIGNLMKEGIHGFHPLLAIGHLDFVKGPLINSHLAGVFLLENRFAANMANLVKGKAKMVGNFSIEPVGIPSV